MGATRGRAHAGTMMLAFLILVAAAVVMFALLMARPRRIPGGRLGRVARLGRLSGYLATSWLGAKLRRLFMSKAGRARYDEARRRADAEAVVQTMGQMKGVVMKLGQMLSFISDGVPAEYRPGERLRRSAVHRARRARSSLADAAWPPAGRHVR